MCRLNVQIARKSLGLTFDDLIVSYYTSAIMAVEKEKSEMSFKSSIKPSWPISQITTSHAFRLKRLETRMTKSVSLIKRVKAQRHVLLVPSGWLAAVSRRSWNIPKIFLLKFLFLFNKKYGMLDFKGTSTKKPVNPLKINLWWKSFFRYWIMF